MTQALERSVEMSRVEFSACLIARGERVRPQVRQPSELPTAILRP